MANMRSVVATVVILVQMQAASATLRGSDPARLLGAFVPNMDKTASAFWSAVKDKSSSPGESAVKARITDNWSAIKAAVADAGISNSKELAMFIANVMQETGEMTTRTEYTSHYTDANYDWGECTGVDAPCQGADCKSKCKVQYFGRGYLQTTWYKNYKAMKDAGKCTKDGAGNTVDIVANPEKVATDETLAWCTAAYYWKHSVHDDRCQNGKCDMGNTIDAINGDLECGTKNDGNVQAQTRFCNYRYFLESYQRERIWWADSACISDLAGMCPVSSS